MALLRRSNAVRFLYLLLPLIVLSSVSCTRKAEDDSDRLKISFSFPAQRNLASAAGVGQGVSSMASGNLANLNHVIMNIQDGNGGNLQVCTWDSKSGSSGPCQFNGNTVVLDVDSGTRIFQALLVYEDANGVMTFDYGDATATLSGAAAIVNLPVSAWGSPSTARAHVYGRYLDAAGNGPSGHLQIRARPSPSRPTMVLMESDMFAGWFKGFVISGVGFEFWLDGVPLSFMTDKSTTPKVVKTSMSFEDFDSLFSNGTTGTPGQVQRVGNAPDYDFGGFFSADTTSTPFTGTTAMTSPSCSVNEYTTCLVVNNSNHSRFMGPFKANGSGNFLTVAGTWTWTYFSAVTGSQIDGVKIYKLTGLTPNVVEGLRPDRDTWDCNKIAATGTLVATEVFPSTTLASPPALGANEGAFLCPYKGAALFNTAIAYPDYLNNMGGSSSGPYLRLDGLYSFQQNNSNIKPLTVGACYPVTFKTYQSGGVGMASPYTMINPLTITLPSTSDVMFYSSAGCTTGNVTTASISATTSQSTNLYMKLVNSSLTSYQFLFTLSGSNEVGYNPDMAFDVGQPVVKYNLPTSLYPNTCYPFHATMFEADAVTPMSYSGSITVSFSSGASDTIWTTTGCTGGAPSSMTFSGTNMSNTYYLLTASAPSGSLGFSGAGFSFLGTNYSQMSAGYGPLPSQIGVTLTGAFEAAKCTAVRLSLKNENNNILPVKASTIVKLSSPGVLGAFYANPNCSGAPLAGNEFTLIPDDYDQDVFFLPFQTSVSMQIKADAGAGLTGSTATTSVATPTDPLFIYPINLPNFYGSQFVGSHEFPGGYKQITFAVTPGASITCMRDTATSCNALLAGNVFSWPASEAVSGVGYNIQITANGGNRIYFFKPSLVYGSQFTVKTCTGVVAPSSLDTFALTSGTYCLDSGTYTLSAALTLNGYDFIGRSDMSSVLNVSGVGELAALSAMASSSIVANLTVNDSGPSATRSTIRSYNANPGALYLDHLNMNVTQNSTYNYSAIKVESTGTHGNVYIGNVNIVASGNSGGSVNGGIMVDSVGSTVEISSVTVSHTAGTAFHGIDVTGSGALGKIQLLKDYTYTGVGNSLYIYGSTAGNAGQILASERLNMVGTAGSGQDLISISGHGTLMMNNSYLKNQSQFLIRLYGPNSYTTLVNNVFHTTADYYAFDLYQSTVSDFTGNQFVKTGTSGNSYQPFSTAGSGPYPTINSTNLASNRFCASNSTYAWHASQRAYVASSLSGSASATLNSATTVNAGPQYVSASQRCTF